MLVILLYTVPTGACGQLPVLIQSGLNRYEHQFCNFWLSSSTTIMISFIDLSPSTICINLKSCVTWTELFLCIFWIIVLASVGVQNFITAIFYTVQQCTLSMVTLAWFKSFSTHFLTLYDVFAEWISTHVISFENIIIWPQKASCPVTCCNGHWSFSIDITVMKKYIVHCSVTRWFQRKIIYSVWFYA